MLTPPPPFDTRRWPKEEDGTLLSASSPRLRVASKEKSVAKTGFVRCTRPRTTLITAVDNVAHGRGQRCTRPRTTHRRQGCNAPSCMRREKGKRKTGGGGCLATMQAESNLFVKPNELAQSREDLSDAMARKGRMGSNDFAQHKLTLACENAKRQSGWFPRCRLAVWEGAREAHVAA